MGALTTPARSDAPILLGIAMIFAALIVVGASLIFPPLALALPIAAAGAILVVRYPYAAIMIVAFLAPLTARMPRGELIPALKISEALIFGTALLVGAHAFIIRRQPVRLHRVELFMLAFLCIRGLLPLIVNMLRGWPLDIDMLKLYLAPIKFWFLVRMAAATCTTARVRNLVVMSTLAAGTIFALIGFVQFIGVPGVDGFLAAVYPSDRDVFVFEYAHRLSSVFAGNWNAAGFYLGACSLLAMYWSTEVSRRWRWPLLSLGAFHAMCLLMTMSFTSLIAFGLGVCVLGVRTKRLKSWVRMCLPFSPIGALVVLAFLPYFQERILLQWGSGGGWMPETFQARIEIWSVLIWPYLRDNLWTGIGPSRFGWRSEENYYYFLVVKAGIPALLAFGVLFRALAQRLSAPLAKRSAVANFTWALVWMAMISNLTGVFMEYAGIAELLWVFVGMSLVVPQAQAST